MKTLANIIYWIGVAVIVAICSFMLVAMVVTLVDVAGADICYHIGGALLILVVGAAGVGSWLWAKEARKKS